jgi:hypothetical protein
VSPFGLRFIAEMQPWMTDALAQKLDAFGSMFDPLDLLINDVGADDGTMGYVPGWGILFDPDLCPPQYLPYLGQFLGVTIPVGASTATARATVKAALGLSRGTPNAIVAAAHLHLQNPVTSTVELVERADGRAYRMGIFTYASQTPSPAQTAADIVPVMPGGIVYTYAAYPGWAIGVMERYYDRKQTAPTNVNYVANSSLEREVTGWSGAASGPITGTSTVARSTSVSYSGSSGYCSLAVTTPGGATTQGATYLLSSTLVPLTFASGQPVTGSAYVLSPVAQTFTITLQDSVAGNGPVSMTLMVPANIWTRLIATWAPTATSTSPAIYVYAASGSAAQVFNIDGVQVETGSTVSTFLEPLAIAAVTNYCTNPSFETDTSGWDGTAQGPVTLVSTLAQSGAQAFVGLASLAVTTPGGAGTQGVNYPLGSIAAGGAVTAQAWVRTTIGQSMTIALRDNVAGNGPVTASVVTTANTWTRLTVTWTPSALSTNARVYVYAASGAAAQTFYLDAVQVEPGSLPTMYGAGTIGRIEESTAGISFANIAALEAMTT